MLNAQGPRHPPGGEKTAKRKTLIAVVLAVRGRAAETANSRWCGQWQLVLMALALGTAMALAWPRSCGERNTTHTFAMPTPVQ